MTKDLQQTYKDMTKNEIVTAKLEGIVKAKVQQLHRYKNELNALIKELITSHDLDVWVEVLETKSDAGPPQLAGIELSVKQEIYP